MSEPPHKSVAEAGVALLVVGSLASFLPPIAAFFGCVWYAILIWESKTGEKLKHRLRTWLMRNGPL